MTYASVEDTNEWFKKRKSLTGEIPVKNHTAHKFLLWKNIFQTSSDSLLLWIAVSCVMKWVYLHSWTTYRFEYLAIPFALLQVFHILEWMGKYHCCIPLWLKGGVWLGYIQIVAMLKNLQKADFCQQKRVATLYLSTFMLTAWYKLAL